MAMAVAMPCVNSLFAGAVLPSFSTASGSASERRAAPMMAVMVTVPEGMGPGQQLSVDPDGPDLVLIKTR